MQDSFTYTYRVKTSDLWQAMMYYSYSSFMGVVNVVFIVSAIALIISRWGEATDLFRALMVVLVLLFTVLQPASIWLRAKAALSGAPREMTLSAGREGLDITADGRDQHMGWDKVRGIVSKPTILILYVGDGSGYILRNSVLGTTRKDFYEFVKDRCQRR